MAETRCTTLTVRVHSEVKEGLRAADCGNGQRNRSRPGRLSSYNMQKTISTNSNLCQTRNLLLPRHISGELDVSEPDIPTGQEAA